MITWLSHCVVGRDRCVLFCEVGIKNMLQSLQQEVAKVCGALPKARQGKEGRKEIKTLSVQSSELKVEVLPVTISSACKHLCSPSPLSDDELLVQLQQPTHHPQTVT